MMGLQTLTSAKHLRHVMCIQRRSAKTALRNFTAAAARRKLSRDLTLRAA